MPDAISVIEKSVNDPQYVQLITAIKERYRQGQKQAIRAVNETIIDTYWSIGRYIVEYEQEGNAKSRYASHLLDKLSKDLTLELGRGFSRSNLVYMRKFYTIYPLGEKLSHQVTWSHYIELLKIEDDAERSFYYQQNISENWSVPELRRQKKTGLYLTLALSKSNADDIKQLSERGQSIESAADIVKPVYFLEFLRIPEPTGYSETALEKKIIDNLQTFLLELGKGFTFVGRQYRITLNNKTYRVDLVFYHRILRCFVLIDLKINDVQHYDISQMNMYMGYFAKEENSENDNPPIGIILSREKDDLLVEYATYEMNSKLFVSKYQLYLPDREELRKLLDAHLASIG